MSNYKDFDILNGYLAQYTGSGGEVVIPDSVTEIGEKAFFNCRTITALTIPQTVTVIHEKAFFNCRNLSALHIPANLTRIEEGAFGKCAGLADNDGFVIVNGHLASYHGHAQQVVVPEGVTVIGADAFFGNTTLTSVSLPSTLTTIETEAFSGCTNLADIQIPGGVVSVGSAAFQKCAALTELTLPDSVRSLGSEVFSFCTGLVCVRLSRNLPVINDETFFYCTNLEQVDLPRSITYVGKKAFYGCSKIPSCHIPDGVNRICDYAFFDCASVVVPKGILYIGPEAFAGCSLLSVPQSVFDKWNTHYCSQTSLGLAVEDNGRWHFYGLSAKTAKDNLTELILPGKWNAYDLDLINNGPAYKYKISARLLGALGRIVDPVDLTDECRGLHLEFLTKNAKKLIPIAESLHCPAIILAMAEHGIIHARNKKAIAKLLAASTVPEIAGIQL